MGGTTQARPATGWAPRLAAIAALTCLLLAVALLGFLLVSRLAALPFAIAAVILAALAGWQGLINRGLRRAVSLVAAGLALGLAIVLLGPSILVGGLVVAGLVVASAAAARAAIGRHRPPTVPLAAGIDLTPVGRAVRPVMLFNPASGGGTVQKSGLIGKAVRRGITCVILREGDDLREIAEREAAAGATVLGMAGGDGSQAVVADVARRHGIAFVCIPAGTRNHLAQDLGIERRKPVRALDAFGPGAVERRVDLGTVNGHVFVNNASMGVYAAIVQAETYRDAKLLTAASLLPDLVGPEAAPFDLRFTGPDGTDHETSDLLLVSNNPYAVVSAVGVGGRATFLAPRAHRPRLDAGELGILSIRRAAAGPLAWTASSFRVDSAEPVAVGLDGEAVTLAPPLEFATLPGVLRVRLAPYVVAPAAVGRAPGVRQTVRSLVRIAFGRGLPTA